jgi:hypothetical protein
MPNGVILQERRGPDGKQGNDRSLLISGNGNHVSFFKIISGMLIAFGEEKAVNYDPT